jgi:hypothetical protein
MSPKQQIDIEQRSAHSTLSLPTWQTVFLPIAVATVLALVAKILIVFGSDDDVLMIVGVYVVPFVVLTALLYFLLLRRFGFQSRNVADFFSGFLSMLASLLTWVAFSVLLSFRFSGPAAAAIAIVTTAVVPVLLVYSLLRHRKYVLIGMVSVLAIAALSFGACFVVVLGMM